MGHEHKSPEKYSENDKYFRFILNIPNTLTLIRLCAIAPLAIMISRWPENRMATFSLFLVIWATDFLDGFIARRFNLMTEFGKLFDPFVDKVFQVVTAFMLFSVGLTPIWVPLYYVVRESFMLFGSALLLTKRNVVVYADKYGKVSTFLFVVATVIMFFGKAEPGWVRQAIFLPAILCSFIATVNYVTRQAGLGKKKDDLGQDENDA